MISTASGDVPRVNGQLAVSRAFGDKSLKSHLRSDPDVQHTDIDPDIDILILASDGLWKVNIATQTFIAQYEMAIVVFIDLAFRLFY